MKPTKEEFLAATANFVWPERPTRAPWSRDQEFRLEVHGDVPEEWDLRKHGILSPPMNQGTGNSCTAFAVTAAVEAAHAKRYGKATKLSAWYVHSCLAKKPDREALWLNDAVELVKKKGIAPAINGDSDAPFPSDLCTAARPEGVTSAPRVSDTEQAKRRISSGQVVVCGAMVRWKDFINLPRGQIYANTPDSRSTPHCICLVGYGKGYWIIQNSNGDNWSSDGFGYLKYGSCGLLDQQYGDPGACFAV